MATRVLAPASNDGANPNISTRHVSQQRAGLLPLRGALAREHAPQTSLPQTRQWCRRVVNPLNALWQTRHELAAAFGIHCALSRRSTAASAFAEDAGVASGVLGALERRRSAILVVVVRSAGTRSGVARVSGRGREPTPGAVLGSCRSPRGQPPPAAGDSEVQGLRREDEGSAAFCGAAAAALLFDRALFATKVALIASAATSAASGGSAATGGGSPKNVIASGGGTCVAHGSSRVS